MADRPTRKEVRGDGELQNLVMPELSRPVLGGSTDKNGHRVIDTRILLVHHMHIQKYGKRTDKRCGFCRYGVGALYLPFKKEIPESSVVPDNRTDPAGDATPPPTDGDAYWLKKGNLEGYA